MNEQMILLFAALVLTAVAIAAVCYMLSNRPYNEINFDEADDGPLNSPYVLCDDYCPRNYCICCNVCEHRTYCKDVCEDYNGPCDVREVVYYGED